MKVRQRVEQFVEKEISIYEPKDKQAIHERREVRTQKFNLYLELFNVVIAKNIDSLECVPNLELLWDNPWGNIVTLKVTCYQT